MEIFFEGQYSKQALLKAQKIHYRPSPVIRVIRIIGIVTVVIIYIAQFVLRRPERFLDEVGILLPAFIILYVLAMPFLLPYSTIQQVMKNPDFIATISGKVNENGVTMNAKRSNSDLKWELFTKYIHKGDLILLYSTNNCFYLFPHYFFKSQVDWDNFQNVIKEKIRKCEVR
jgi:hypothetical protein